jgi:pyruvate dehydrogenase E1 component alpha subunit
MQPDVWFLYRLMLKSRLYEEAIKQIWNDGLISGEMHLGTGEEGIIAGVISQLGDGDALALDHRATSAMLMRGVDPVRLLQEIRGHPDGLSGGQGGHMHLFSKSELAISSGIVGASGPAAAGFALAAQYLRPGKVAVAFFGDGAMNQGMLMEAFNLAAAWKLPVLFVCKDDNWAITTDSASVTGGTLADRARAMGLKAFEADGRDVQTIWLAAQTALLGARSGEGPAFLHATCVHLEGHFLGLQLIRAIRNPVREIPGIAAPLMRSFLSREGSTFIERLPGLGTVLASMLKTFRDPRRESENDPVIRARLKLQSDPERLRALEDEIELEVREILQSALAKTSEEPAA